jgi:hypothetical protein
VFEAFIESLEIPDACRIEHRLHKKQFYELGRMNRGQQEQFASAVESITWTHTLKKSTINIASFVTHSVEYLEIAFIHVRLKEKVSVKKVAEVIHRIPYPVVLFLTYGDELCLSAALKRINQADISKLTVDEYLQSDWVNLKNPSDTAAAFFESLKVSNLSFENFYRFYQDICDRIIAFEAASYGAAFSTVQTPQKKQNIDKIKSIENQIISLRAMLKKETQFNVKVELNIRMKKLNDEMEGLKSSL